MIAKVDVLCAVRDLLRARCAEVNGRVWVTLQDAQGNQLIPTEAECPFLTVADAGQDIAPQPAAIADGLQRVRVRAYVQDLRDTEAPIVGHAASGSVGAASLQDIIAALLQGDTLTGQGLTGIEQALVESLPPVGLVSDDDGWDAVFGDVAMRYTFERDSS